METTMTHEYPKGVTLDDVWAVLRDVAERQKETDRLMKENAERQKETDQQMKETDRLMKENAERQKETDRQMKETDQQMKETDRYIKEIGKQLGGFKNTFGEVVEHLVSPNLQEKFKRLGYDFQEASTRHKVKDHNNNVNFEIDVFLQNGDTAMLVEIKSNLTISDIKKHILRLEKMRSYADSRGDKRHFLGAVAGIVIEKDEREYALSEGFFLIEPSGEDYEITPPPGKPKEW